LGLQARAGRGFGLQAILENETVRSKGGSGMTAPRRAGPALSCAAGSPAASLAYFPKGWNHQITDKEWMQNWRSITRSPVSCSCEAKLIANMIELFALLPALA
jgi:hypothetical protein